MPHKVKGRCAHRYNDTKTYVAIFLLNIGAQNKFLFRIGKSSQIEGLNTATRGVEFLRVALNVPENVVGMPPDGSDSSIMSAACVNGSAAADVNVTITASSQKIRNARIL